MQMTKLFPEYTVKQRRWMASRENPANPLHTIVGQNRAVEMVEQVIYTGLGRNIHNVSDFNIAWTGPPGVGKTRFGTAIAQALGIPFISLNPQSLKKTDDVFRAIQSRLEKEKVGNRSLKMVPLKNNTFSAPVCVVFIDEIHQLSPTSPVIQGLLTACEPGTHRLEGSFGTMNTWAIQWQFATTDRGRLFDAFDTRFVKIELEPYSKKEIAQIVKAHFPFIPSKACAQIAKYAWRVTREALDFAKLAMYDREFNRCTWMEAIENVRKRLGIDEHGLDRVRLAVLTALGRGSCSLEGLEIQARRKVEELKKFVLPPMRQFGHGIEPLISVGSKGYSITEAGKRELAMRGIPCSV